MAVAALLSAVVTALILPLVNVHSVASEKFDNIKRDMTEEQVISLVGPPDAIDSDRLGGIEWDYYGISQRVSNSKMAEFSRQ